MDLNPPPRTPSGQFAEKPEVGLARRLTERLREALGHDGTTGPVEDDLDERLAEQMDLTITETDLEGLLTAQATVAESFMVATDAELADAVGLHDGLVAAGAGELVGAGAGEKSRVERVRGFGAPKWDPLDHPRDGNGRFATVGSTVSLPGGGSGRVTGNNGDGTINVHKDDGSNVSVDAKETTVTASSAANAVLDGADKPKAPKKPKPKTETGTAPDSAMADTKPNTPDADPRDKNGPASKPIPTEVDDAKKRGRQDAAANHYQSNVPSSNPHANAAYSQAYNAQRSAMAAHERRKKEPKGELTQTQRDADMASTVATMDAAKVEAGKPKGESQNITGKGVTEAPGDKFPNAENVVIGSLKPGDEVWSPGGQAPKKIDHITGDSDRMGLFYDDGTHEYLSGEKSSVWRAKTATPPPGVPIAERAQGTGPDGKPMMNEHGDHVVPPLRVHPGDQVRSTRDGKIRTVRKYGTADGTIEYDDGTIERGLGSVHVTNDTDRVKPMADAAPAAAPAAKTPKTQLDLPGTWKGTFDPESGKVQFHPNTSGALVYTGTIDPDTGKFTPDANSGKSPPKAVLEAVRAQAGKPQGFDAAAGEGNQPNDGLFDEHGRYKRPAVGEGAPAAAGGAPDFAGAEDVTGKAQYGTVSADFKATAEPDRVPVGDLKAGDEVWSPGAGEPKTVVATQPGKQNTVEVLYDDGTKERIDGFEGSVYRKAEGAPSPDAAPAKAPFESGRTGPATGDARSAPDPGVNTDIANESRASSAADLDAAAQARSDSGNGIWDKNADGSWTTQLDGGTATVKPNPDGSWDVETEAYYVPEDDPNEPIYSYAEHDTVAAGTSIDDVLDNAGSDVEGVWERAMAGDLWKGSEADMPTPPPAGIEGYTKPERQDALDKVKDEALKLAESGEFPMGTPESSYVHGVHDAAAYLNGEFGGNLFRGAGGLGVSDAEATALGAAADKGPEDLARQADQLEAASDPDSAQHAYAVALTDALAFARGDVSSNVFQGSAHFQGSELNDAGADAPSPAAAPEVSPSAAGGADVSPSIASGDDDSVDRSLWTGGIPPGGHDGATTRPDGTAWGSGFASNHPRSDPAYDQYLDDLDSRMTAALDNVGDTETLFDKIDGVAGAYRPERQVVHDALIDALMAEYAGVPKDRKSIVMGGPPGAGKSTVIKQRGHEFGVIADEKGVPTNYAVVNPDDFKGLLIEQGFPADYDPFSLGPQENASILHEESSHLAGQLLDRLRADGYNVILDGTFAGDPAKQTRKVVSLKNDGYSVAGVLVDGEVDTSLSRAASRHRKPPKEAGGAYEGRYVPYDIIEGNRPKGDTGDSSVFGRPHRNRSSENLEANADVFDGGVAYYDNSQGGAELAKSTIPKEAVVNAQVSALQTRIASVTDPAIRDALTAQVDSLVASIASKSLRDALGYQIKAAGGADQNRGGAEKLRAYWVHGEGAAKIQWGTEGDFDRCVALVSEHMDPERAKGYCNLRHHDATGAYPGHAPGEEHKSLERFGLTAGQPIPWQATAIKASADGVITDAEGNDQEKTGVMVALYVPDETAQALDVPNGTAPPQMHVTLAYLGKTTDVEDPDLLRQTIEAFAADSFDVDGFVSGVGRFAAGEDGDAFYASVDCPELPDFRADVVDALEAAGFDVRSDHGFTPHITLAYLTADDPSPLQRIDPIPVTFGTLSVSYGEDTFDYPLTDNESFDGNLTEAEQDPEPVPAAAASTEPAAAGAPPVEAP